MGGNVKPASYGRVQGVLGIPPCVNRRVNRATSGRER